MKKILSLVNTFIATILLLSCSAEQPADDVGERQETKGLMEIKVVTDGALEDDYIHTARFITFDNASVFPSVDMNELKEFDEDEQKARVFSALLKVSCNTDKLLVVILNEPTAITGFLRSVSALADLEDITYLMADAFNNNHTAAIAKGIPMTGIARKLSVAKENDSEENAVTVELSVKRAVARVELWLRTEQGIASEVNTSTTVTLSKSHDGGYLMAPEPAEDFGYMPTVASPDKEVTWRYTGSDPLKLADTLQLVCAFYTPERTCSAGGDADKLVLDIRKISVAGEDRDAMTVLSDFSNEGSPSRVITEINRNNVYKIAAYVKRKMVEFEQKVVPWKEVGQSIIIDPQYFLTVSRDDLYLPEDGDNTTIKAETNYDRVDDDRGFQKGICLGLTRYYDRSGQLVENTGSNLYGWLVTIANGAEGELMQNLFFYISDVQYVDYKGCYATVEVKAGNLIKLIKVRR
nr:hypothetical protein [Parabacteroides goldsteinii]